MQTPKEKQLLQEKAIIEQSRKAGGLSLQDARRLTQIKSELSKIQKNKNPVAKV